MEFNYEDGTAYIIPIRCQTCGTVLARKVIVDQYAKVLTETKSIELALKSLDNFEVPLSPEELKTFKELEAFEAFEAFKSLEALGNSKALEEFKYLESLKSSESGQLSRFLFAIQKLLEEFKVPKSFKALFLIKRIKIKKICCKSSIQNPQVVAMNVYSNIALVEELDEIEGLNLDENPDSHLLGVAPSPRLPGLSVPGLSVPGLSVPGLPVPGLPVPGLPVPGLRSRPPMSSFVTPRPLSTAFMPPPSLRKGATGFHSSLTPGLGSRLNQSQQIEKRVPEVPVSYNAR
jgi:hypothetical protein